MTSIGPGNDFQKWVQENDFSKESLNKAAKKSNEAKDSLILYDFGDSSTTVPTSARTSNWTDKESLNWLLGEIKNKENLKKLSPEQMRKLREFTTSLDKEIHKDSIQHKLANKLPFSLGKLTTAKSAAKKITAFEKEQFLGLVQNAKNLNPAEQSKFTALLPSVLPTLSKKEQTALLNALSPVPDWLIKDEQAFKSICTLAFKQGSLYSFIGNTTDQTALKMVADVVNEQVGIKKFSLKALTNRSCSIDIPMRVGTREKTSPESCEKLDAIIAKVVLTRMLARLGQKDLPAQHALYEPIGAAFKLHLAQCKDDSCQFQLPSSSSKTAAVDASNKCFHFEKVSNAWQLKLPDSIMTVYDVLASDPNDLEKDLLKIWTQHCTAVEVDILQPRLQELKERLVKLNLPDYDPVLIDIGMGADRLQIAHFELDTLFTLPPTSANLTKIRSKIEELEKRADVQPLMHQKSTQTSRPKSSLENPFVERDKILSELTRMASSSATIKENLHTLSNATDAVGFTNALKKLAAKLQKHEQNAIKVQAPKTSALLEAASLQGKELQQLVLDYSAQSSLELSSLYERSNVPHLWSVTPEDVTQYLDALRTLYNGLDETKKSEFETNCPTAFMLVQANK